MSVNKGTIMSIIGVALVAAVVVYASNRTALGSKILKGV